MIQYPRPLPPHHTSARMLRPLLDYVSQAGHDPQVVLPPLGVDPRHLQADDASLSYQELAALVRAARRLTGRSDLAMRMGRSANPVTALGGLAFAATGCSTVEDMIRFFIRHVATSSGLMTAQYRREADRGVIRVVPDEVLEHDVLAFMLELWATLAHGVFKVLGGAPDEVAAECHVGMPEPAHHVRQAQPPYDRVFYDSPLPGLTIVMPRALCELPLPMGDARMVAQFEAALAEQDDAAEQADAAAAAGVAGVTAVAARVRDLLRGAPAKPPSIEEVAQGLGMSARTLERGLAREDVNFRDVAREVLIERARAMLARPGASITQVALRLGFSDAANFTRSFRNATGLTPGEVRDELRGAGAAGSTFGQ